MEDSIYPKRLKSLPDAPFSLYVKGELPKEELPSVAIVGARVCSEYGREAAFYFGEQLAKAQVQIISGMAAGIDAWGQKGALKQGKNVCSTWKWGGYLLSSRKYFFIYANSSKWRFNIRISDWNERDFLICFQFEIELSVDYLI